MLTEDPRTQDIKAKNQRSLLLLGLLLIGMGFFAWGLVPFYRMVCTKFGVGVVPQKPNAAVVPTHVGTRVVTVRFIGMSNVGTPATLEPLESKVTVHVGETRQVNYRFTNLTGRPLEFQAVHSVTPASSDAMFHKLVCFCFTRQKLKPHETREMPISFWIDDKLDPEVDTVTLQYTLYALHPDRAALKAVRS